MKIGEKVEAMEISMGFLGNQSIIHPTVFWDDGEGATLIDTGLPGQVSLIRQKLSGLGLRLRDIRRILLTHQDIDHIGSAQALVEASGARVFAHEADAPYISGEKKLLKMDVSRFEARLEALPEREREQARRLLDPLPRVRVDQILKGREELPFHGGIVVIYTPGRCGSWRRRECCSAEVGKEGHAPTRTLYPQPDRAGRLFICSAVRDWSQSFEPNWSSPVSEREPAPNGSKPASRMRRAVVCPERRRFRRDARAAGDAWS
jgi:hypothetical protein